MAKLTLFGIPNCDTVKKARRWLEQNDIAYQFHDFRRDGLDEKRLKQWFRLTDWEQLLNRRSRTWRELNDADKENITQTKAIKLMLAQPSIIKRPVAVTTSNVTIGFDSKTYSTEFL